MGIFRCELLVSGKVVFFVHLVKTWPRVFHVSGKHALQVLQVILTGLVDGHQLPLKHFDTVTFSPSQKGHQKNCQVETCIYFMLFKHFVGETIQIWNNMFLWTCLKPPSRPCSLACKREMLKIFRRQFYSNYPVLVHQMRRSIVQKVSLLFLGEWMGPNSHWFALVGDVHQPKYHYNESQLQLPIVGF